MTATVATCFVVTDHELQMIACRAGLQALPDVLALRPRYGTETAMVAAFDAASRRLAERGLIDDGQMPPEVVAVLSALQRPDRELAMRLVTPDGIVRLTVVRQGSQCVSARRVGDEITIKVVEGQSRLATATGALLCVLPPAAAAKIDPVGAPLDAASHALTGTHDAALLADRIRAFGADPRTAMLLGQAFASRQAFAEIVYYALDGDEDRISRCPAAVGVFYTKRGRIVAAPSMSPSGQLWTTLKPGSDHVIKQAVGQLVELSAERWEAA